VIGISLAHHLGGRGASITLADLSSEALELARGNAVKLLPEGARVRFVSTDLFAALAGERYDLVVANLPYIPSSAETLLSREVRRDPALALYGGETGTEVMARFLSEVGDHLNPGGRLAMEFGIDQAPVLLAMAGEAGYEDVEIRKDIGGIERFLFAVKKGQGC